jgi:proline iminopeptidase
VPVAGDRLAAGDHLAELDGATLAYHVAGTGPVCLALPGGPGIDSAYLRSAAERHLTLVYIDPVGTGGSARLPDPGGYTRARYAADLERLRAYLGLERPCFMGHSFGGLVVLLYAVQHPDRVGRLILYDATARADAELAASARELLARRKGASWYDEVAAGFSATVGPATDEEATRLVLATAPAYFHDWEARKDELLGALRRSRASAAPMTAPDRTRADVRADLGKIAAPTLVLVGRDDFVCAPRFAEEIAAGIPGAKLHVFERSGHFAHLEEPEAFALAIAEFLE